MDEVAKRNPHDVEHLSERSTGREVDACTDSRQAWTCEDGRNTNLHLRKTARVQVVEKHVSASTVRAWLLPFLAREPTGLTAGTHVRFQLFQHPEVALLLGT